MGYVCMPNLKILIEHVLWYDCRFGSKIDEQSFEKWRERNNKVNNKVNLRVLL